MHYFMTKHKRILDDLNRYDRIVLRRINVRHDILTECYLLLTLLLRSRNYSMDDAAPLHG